VTRLVHPVAGSAKKVYIARGRETGAPVALSGSGGEGVQFVDDPGLAEEVVTVYVGSNKTSRATAKRLEKACLEEQKRQQRGKKDKGVFDRTVTDFEVAPPKRSKKTSDGGMRFVTALFVAALIWTGLCLYVARDAGIAAALLALVLGFAVVPAVATMLKLMDVFLPEGMVGLAGLGLGVLAWGAGLGIVDVADKPAGHPGAASPRGGAGTTRNSQRALASGSVDGAVAGSSGSVRISPAADPWPGGQEAYTVILASKARKGEAAAFAERAPVSVGPTGVLRSDNYTTLLPGYWVAFAGRLPTAERALNGAERLHETGFADAFGELISTRPQDPTGTITASTIGSLRVGMSVEQVRRYVTEPDVERTVGFGSGPGPETDWTWRLPDGELTLQFDRAGGRLKSFESTTGQVATTSGLGVGDSFAPIQRRYGGQIRRSPLGEHTLVLSEGRPGTFPALTFSVYDGAIEAIAGGLPRPAGE
jgi:hypothetical protein